MKNSIPNVKVSKLIEKVTNPNFFNYAASEPLPGTRATIFRSDDNYFCYDQAKCLLTQELNLDISHVVVKALVNEDSYNYRSTSTTF